jgi:hypothetical protein
MVMVDIIQRYPQGFLQNFQQRLQILPVLELGLQQVFSH